MTDTLKTARKNIAEAGGNELTACKNQPAAQKMWEKIQILRSKRYNAIKTAIETASKPFDEEIADLEEQYALFLRLAT